MDDSTKQESPILNRAGKPIQDLEVREKQLPTASPTRDPVAAASPDNLLAQAVASGASIDVLERLMDLKERHDAQEARKAWIHAVAQFKANAPDIFKEKKVQYLTQDNELVSYDHATLGNVCAVIAQSLGRFGLSHRWVLSQESAVIKVTCILAHEQGHEEQTYLEAPPDTSGKKNTIQQTASTVTYLERYTLLASVGMAAQDQDDDGIGSTIEYISEEQAKEIQDRLADIQANQVVFLRAAGVGAEGTFTDIPTLRIKSVMANLEKLEKAAAKRGGARGR